MRLLKYKRLIAGVVIVLVIVGMAMWPESIEVSVATVERGAMQVTLDEDGETRVRDKFVVSAPVAGRLQRIELEPGDAVVRGKTIVARLTTADAPLLDPRTRGELEAAVEGARAAVGQASAELQRATTELARARTTLQRQQELMKAGAIAADNLDAAETAVATGEEARKASAAELGHHIKGLIGITAKINVVDPGGVERSQGKARRVIDKRPRD